MPGGTRNKGVEQAKNETLSFTNSDCIVPRDWLLKLEKLLEESICGVNSGYAWSVGNSFIEKFQLYDVTKEKAGKPGKKRKAAKKKAGKTRGRNS